MSELPAVGDVERFRTAIGGTLGLAFDDTKLDQLARVLRRRLAARGVAAAEYLAGLGIDRDEQAALGRELTVNETYFFRHQAQFDAFTEVVLPDRLRARAAVRQLSLASLGCASGEEPYTLAMLLADRVDPSWDVSIVAADVSPEALDRARRGRYTAWSLRETPPEMRRRWFREVGDQVVLDERVRARVRFVERNLADEASDLWPPASYDVVFCRNVVMYFRPAVMERVIARITRSLQPGGYLFLGHAETLRGISSDYHLHHTHGTFYYQRRGSPAPSPRVPPPRTPAVAAAGDPDWAEAIGRASARIDALARAPVAAPRSATLRRAPRWRSELAQDERSAQIAPVPAAMPAPPRALAAALELLREERFADALAVLDALPETDDADVLLLEAVLRTHQGQWAAAESVCERLLVRDDLNAAAHYVRALCREGAGDRDGAIAQDQMAAYLDPTFAMPRLHLGILARRAGDRDAARDDLAQALALLQREDASRLLLFGGGFQRDALLAVCRAELLACGGAP